MLHIGIVGGDHVDVALELKAALLALDSSLTVSIDEGDMRHDADDPRTAFADKQINQFNAVLRLAAAGAQVVAFSCGCPHKFFDVLQREVSVRLVDSVDDQLGRLPVEEYAKRILAADPTPPAKPFKVGLIGGLGPAATVDLYDKIVRATPAANDQEHFKLVVEQNPQTPDRTKCLLEGGEDPTLALYNSAVRLQADGCDALIVPCNTAHAFVPFLQRHLKVPFINMQQVTMDEIQAKYGKSAKVGLLATSGTVKTGIYSVKSLAMGIPMVAPDQPHQELVMRAIYGPKGAKAGFTDGQCREDLLSAAEYLVEKHGCNVLILGCTELPLILDEGDMEIAGRTVFVIDPTSALARKVVKCAEESFARSGVR